MCECRAAELRGLAFDRLGHAVPTVPRRRRLVALPPGREHADRARRAVRLRQMRSGFLWRRVRSVHKLDRPNSRADNDGADSRADDDVEDRGADGTSTELDSGTERYPIVRAGPVSNAEAEADANPDASAVGSAYLATDAAPDTCPKPHADGAPDGSPDAGAIAAAKHCDWFWWKSCR